MENSMLILSATLWRLVSYLVRGFVLNLTISFGQGPLYDTFLFGSIALLFTVVMITLKFSEMNAMGKAADKFALRLGTFLDSSLWVSVLLTLAIGLFNVTIF